MNDQKTAEILHVYEFVKNYLKSKRHIDSIDRNFEDLLQECYFYIEYAWEKFDPTRGVKFSTFAFRFVKIRVFRKARSLSSVVGGHEKSAQPDLSVDAPVCEDSEKTFVETLVSESDTHREISEKQIAGLVIDRMRPGKRFSEQSLDWFYRSKFGGESQSDIAREHGISRAAVSSRVLRVSDRFEQVCSNFSEGVL